MAEVDPADGGRPRPVVLGSASPARRKLLLAAGIEPVVRVSTVDEDEVLAQARAGLSQSDHPSPEQIALMLAVAKAHDVAGSVLSEAAYHQALVIGCDSVLEWQGQAWGKPVSVADATARWTAMRGTSGTLLTGHCVVDLISGRRVAEVVATEVWFADVSDDEIRAYVATGEPLAVAGAFTLDGLGSAFVARIAGDPSNVIGLSIPWLRRTVGDLGLDWSQLWRVGP